MAATGDKQAAAEPIRTCVGCRSASPQRRLLRFARRGDGHVVPANITRDLSGRSAYLCPRRACFDQALKRRAFTRAFSTGRRRISVIDVDIDALWIATAEQLRREIDLLGRTSESSPPPPRSVDECAHAHPRRRGFEQLLSELSSQPKPAERSASRRVHTQPQAIVTEANEPQEPHTPREGGAPSHG